ncbi:unnamed protein product [Scytosiphon promiscuus]
MDACETVAGGDSSCPVHSDGDEIIKTDPNTVGSATDRSGEVHEDTAQNVEAEGSLEAVRLLDEELAELEKLMRLQQKKVDALERLRRQWLSGERKLPDSFPMAPLKQAFLDDDSLGNAAPVSGGYQGISTGKRGHEVGILPPLLSQQLPTGQFEHYTTPHNSFRSSSPVVAAEMLSFRLKGGKSRSPSGGGSGSSGGGISSGNSRQRSAGGVRSGFLNVFAYLHADGVVRLRDADGEEIVSFDSGHGRADTTASLFPSSSSAADPDSPAGQEAKTAAGAGGAVVVGMAADASEASPVIVTAGADGTARVHSLAVHYRERQVAGSGRGRERRDGGGGGGSGKGKKTPLGGRGGDDSAGGDADAGRRGSTSRSRTGKEPRGSKRSSAEETNGVEDDSPTMPSAPRPPSTVMGVGVAVEFKACLGPACRGLDDSTLLETAEASDESATSGAPAVNGGEGTEEAAAEGSPPEEQAATVTSMDAFYHRSLGTTVVIAGYSSGGVRFFHAGNGTELASAETGSSAVLAVKRGGQSIAFSDGEDVHFVSTAKFARAPGRVCRGSRRGGVGVGVGGEGEAVTALAFDAVSTAVLYVGFESGEVMAYDSRFQEVDSSYSCLPSHRLPPPLSQAEPLMHGGAAPGSASRPAGEGGSVNGQSNNGGGGGGGDGRPEGGGCDSISSVRGYVVASQGPFLSVYNTTDEASRLLFTRRTTRTASESATGAAAADMQRPGHCGEGSYAAAGSEDGQGTGGGGDATAGEGAAASTPSGWRHWSVMSSTTSGEVFLAEAPLCSVETVVHKAVLPYDRIGPDISWMRVPIVLLGLLVVAITQVYSRRAAKSAIGGRTSGRKKSRGARAWKEHDSFSDHDDGDGGLSVDRLARLRGAGRRDWDRLGAEARSSGRSLAPRQGYGDPWEQDSD